MKPLFCFKVAVETTNALRDTYCVSSGRIPSMGIYFDCRDGVVYVVAENMGQIHRVLGDVVISCERLGYGRIVPTLGGGNE